MVMAGQTTFTVTITMSRDNAHREHDESWFDHECIREECVSWLSDLDYDNVVATVKETSNTKAVNIQMVDEFDVGENVYDAFLHHLKYAVESGDLTGFDFHVIDDSIELPSDGVLT